MRSDTITPILALAIAGVTVRVWLISVLPMTKVQKNIVELMQHQVSEVLAKE